MTKISSKKLSNKLDKKKIYKNIFFNNIVFNEKNNLTEDTIKIFNLIINDLIIPENHLVKKDIVIKNMYILQSKNIYFVKSLFRNFYLWCQSVFWFNSYSIGNNYYLIYDENEKMIKIKINNSKILDTSMDIPRYDNYLIIIVEMYEIFIQYICYTYGVSMKNKEKNVKNTKGIILEIDIIDKFIVKIKKNNKLCDYEKSKLFYKKNELNIENTEKILCYYIGIEFYRTNILIYLEQIKKNCLISCNEQKV
jgi:hypothetical protein